MKLMERLWRVGPAPALLALLVLLAPLAGCVHDASEHAPNPVRAWVDASGVLVDAPVDALGTSTGGADEHCMRFCAPDTPDRLHSATPHLATTPPPPQPMLLVAILVLLLVAAPRAPARRRRGPPPLSVVSGRMLLTRLCIARR
ncbi:hypothetical protein JK358_19475 [Nocardia sp. 2]|uniref:Uncharacterized protein n=1 Tax=Nocardia acididurans TaxID=2802282 RepID=A0ABS1MBM1_9NOCA|nr:hypothetical protein [Nocardia acididurans]MBL1076583.1 hypothetical protein [Nocardia acididurans]